MSDHDETVAEFLWWKGIDEDGMDDYFGDGRKAMQKALDEFHPGLTIGQLREALELWQRSQGVTS